MYRINQFRAYSLMIIAITCLYSMSTMAKQQCFDTFYMPANYVPPKGWHITLNQAKPGDKLAFYIAVYNSDQKNGANGFRVSCLYQANRKNAEFEVTTDTVYPNLETDSDTDWQTLDDTTAYCYPNNTTNPALCSWD